MNIRFSFTALPLILISCLFSGNNLLAQRTALDLLPRQWVVADQNRFGEVVPDVNCYGDYFGFDFDWNGRVTYTSSPARGLQFRLNGSWEYFPRERLLVVYYTSKRGNLGNRDFVEKFPPQQETYFVERINTREMILRSQSRGRDFALLSGNRFSRR